MQRRQVIINAAMSVVQTVMIGGIAFLFYRYLLQTIGVDQLGIWSLVLATTTLTRIADFGLTGSAVKFVAKYAARAKNKEISEVIQTAVLSTAALIGLFLLIVYPTARRLLGLIVPHSVLEEALLILPYSLMYYQLRHLYSHFMISNIIVLVFVTFLAVPIWLHPMRKRLIEWIAQDLVKMVKTT